MASSRSTVREVDNGWKLLLKRLVGLRKGIDISVGIQGNEAVEQHDSEDPGPLTNVKLGSIHEFGATIENGFGRGIRIIIPQRSFLRATFDENRKKYERMLFVAAKKSIDAVNGLIDACKGIDPSLG